MELNELERHEVVVLSALLRFAAMADNRVSVDEADEIHTIAAAIGAADYEAAAKDAQQRIRNLEGLQEHLATVVRQPAQELIFGTVLDLSIRDSVDAGEGDLLEMLTAAWGIEVAFETPEELAGGDEEA